MLSAELSMLGGSKREKQGGCFVEKLMLPLFLQEGWEIAKSMGRERRKGRPSRITAYKACPGNHR